MSGEASQVVVGFDFSHSAHAALERAVGVVVRAPWHVLHFVCVIDPHFAFPVLPTKRIDLEYAERVQAAATEVIEQELQRQQVADRVHFFVHARIGKAAREILDAAQDLGADLIIVGSKGLTGVERALLGSTSEKVAREAGCTVEVAREKTYRYVPLLDIVDANHAHHKYIPPHRYTYESRRVNRRPPDWPLY